MEIVKAVSLTKIYENKNIYVKALDNISLSIHQGEFIAIVGTSGSGKTTLLNMLGGLDQPSRGIVTINGISLNDMDEEELSVFRRENIGFVFQNYNLIPILNAYENIVLPLRLGEREINHDYIEELAQCLGVGDKLYQMPDTLSGGQQQRIAIIRALCTKPALVLADEPTGNLDSKTGNEVISLIRDLSKQYQQTIVMVTHNDEIAKGADRIIRVEDGKIL